MGSCRVIVDENVGTATALWTTFQDQLGGRYDDYLFLGKAHPGIPDVEILDKLLGSDTLLLTADCVLHQRAIEAGFRSYTLNEQGQLTRRRLPNVRIDKPLPSSVHKTLKADYRAEPTRQVPARMKTLLTDRDFKRLRTARRRIRSHFGSLDAITQVSITIGAMPTKAGLLSGAVLRFAGDSGVKGLRGNESYCLPKTGGADPAMPLFHGLRILYLLQFEQIQTDVFVIPADALQLAQCLTDDATQAVAASPLQSALGRIVQDVPKLSLHPCAKGPFFDEMQHKLRQLAPLKSNEIKRIDFDALAAVV